MMMYTKAGPLALKSGDGIHVLLIENQRTADRIKDLCAPGDVLRRSHVFQPAIAVIPFLIRHGVFGIVRMTGTGCRKNALP